ncbi:MAG TPA: Gfo/Idh/MocA family oxidoreductase [Bryobacteraceae bacterium]|nr:Gfo/Idh/MocA family oxidoreductase [Bryobacteraceae bacterium]
MKSDSNRRQFLGAAAAAAAAFTIVPRRVLGGPNYIPPSDQINLAYIGTGTQGLREMPYFLASGQIRITAVCDPNRYATNYRDWDRDGLLNFLRRTVKKSDWGTPGTIPGGREAGKSAVETYYASETASGTYKGCAAYADFREMLEKEKGIDAIKIMTPDHLHGIIAIAAMKRGKHVITHKPISNRLKEAQLVIETARQTGVSTHFMPWDSNGDMTAVMGWIEGGAIGTLREVHNWTNRPVWPQYTTLPSERPPVPDGFDWNLWLGPEADRAYHPDYTNMVFRGWYDFGGGSMADMGHYSLWTVFNALDLAGPTSIEPMLSHACNFRDHDVANTIHNDYSFPFASVVRFRYPARGKRGTVDLVWYDGGIRPATPPELEEDGEEMPAEGMMFVGDKGKILAGFQLEDPHLIPIARMRGQQAPPRRPHTPIADTPELTPSLMQWVAACRGDKQQSPGSFLHASGISEAVNLYAIALRTGRRLIYDPAAGTITNFAEANRYLAREYRSGWDPRGI